ncbi:MAG: DinB family protein [Saonia sp.]
MKKTLFILIGLFISLTNAQELAIPTFLEKWENSKAYLIQLAEAMPQEKYTYKPTAREMDFREQLIHIRGNMLWLSGNYFLNKKIKKEDLAVSTLDKDELILLISEGFDSVAEIVKTMKPEDLSAKVDFFAGEKTKFQILNLLQDHVTHHRGQLIVYLNLNKIEPPRYTGW